VCEENKKDVAFSSAFHDPSSEDCKQTNIMQTRSFLKLYKKYCTILLRAKHLPVKELIDTRCHALEAVPERRAIHKLNAFFSYRKLRVSVNIIEYCYRACHKLCFYDLKIQEDQMFYYHNSL